MSIRNRKGELEATQQTIKFFETLLRASSDGILITDVTQNIIIANEAFCTLFGQRRRNIIETNIFVWLEQLTDDGPRRWAELEQQVQLQSECRDVEFQLYPRPRESRQEGTKDEILYLSVNASLLEYVADEEAVIISTWRDITAQKRAEKALLRESRLEATTTLAGGIAHDFNNLMVGVLGNAELLKDLAGHLDAAHQTAVLNMLTIISESAQKASRLAQQMLAYARGGKYWPVTMNLNTTIQNMLRLQVQEQTLPSGIRVKRNLAPNLWEITADTKQMSEVLLNLLTNAIEAIESSGLITVTTRNIVLDAEFCLSHSDLKPGAYVYLSVQDTGYGIPVENLPKVFEPFFTTKFHGRGMGLAAVYGIVENHGGHISVYSKAERGAVFEVYLPAIQAKKPPQSAHLTGITGTETILIVEDDEPTLKVAQKMIERFGYSVLVARNGQKAVEIARTFDGEIHLVLLDMNMPVMDGAEAYPLLKAARPETRVIICSGYNLDTVAQAILDAGAAAFIHKPFRMSKLGAEIRRVLAKTKI